MNECSELWICCQNEGDRFDVAYKNSFADKISQSGRRLALMLYKPDDLFEGRLRLLTVDLYKKNMKIKFYRTIISSVYLYGCET